MNEFLLLRLEDMVYRERTAPFCIIYSLFINKVNRGISRLTAFGNVAGGSGGMDGSTVGPVGDSVLAGGAASTWG